MPPKNIDQDGPIQLDNVDSDFISQLGKNDGKDFFEKQFQVVKRVYIDIEFLQDIKLGALVCLSGPEKMGYIKSCIPYYNASNIFNGITKYFPDLNLTEEEVNNFIADPNNHEQLLLLSPNTDFYHAFPDFLYQMVRHNEKIDPSSRITITINFRHLSLHEQYKQFMRHTFNGMHDKLNINCIAIPYKELNVRMMEEANFLFIYRLQRIIDEDSPIHKLLFVSRRWFENGGIFAIRKIEDGKEILGREIDYAFEATKRFIGVYADLEFLQPKIPIYK